MNGVIEALHIFDDSRSSSSAAGSAVRQAQPTNPPYRAALLSHTYSGRPLSAVHLLPLYLEHPTPRPSLIYTPNTIPPTLVFSLTHANLLFLATASTDIEPLLVLEFLHRIVDALEDFLGSPLLAFKIENNYDVVAQLLTEMCDAGIICTTEPNALREVVGLEGWMDKLLGSISLPGKTSGTNFSNSGASSLVSSSTAALPWRRVNVRHTSNEMYADVVETLSVTLAPSGRPLAAFANGTIAFTAKVSGVPEITVNLTSPSGKHNIGSVMELPVFHPCVRLNRWKERPGELSFVPPDGRFTLAGYEVDLLPFKGEKSGNSSAHSLKLPLSFEMKKNIGPLGSEFKVRVQIQKMIGNVSGLSGNRFGRVGGSGRLGSSHSGPPGAPSLEDVKITIPLPAEVRNLSNIRPSRGDANFNPTERVLEWQIPSKDFAGPTSQFGLRCTVVGPLTRNEAHEAHESERSGLGLGTEHSYNKPYQSLPAGGAELVKSENNGERESRQVAQNKMLMPSSVLVSFAIKGWLASGLKVESIVVDTRSRGLGEGVKPYKGVKYLTVSKDGVEMRV